ncbi:nudix hydrolase 13, mitochondrial-like [Phalaenopsis equestris]|uniref:nudix hydrolase 13, mitochondrial-like n=1 Tax=Phalaenopsis equestris TaxID=78828 RepID=UPI0009E22ACE|nr:nudix hydrolase 13, mitochondrial-like [Phalaenopsis equestris]XP_020587757.1 nudix hydrolase 13, mitochondrial-like [Phalaenopsis equestris]XP_020587758.1 nudix hydrolase 13, mitochondrial-like [Phalaenopsis equestris]
MSTNLEARTGRELQRYENHFRLVAGCIPYRLKQNVENSTGDLLSKLEVLMITTPNRHDLIFPKGGWDNDETVDQAACREAFEEAGVRGIIHDTLLGVWEFKSKSKQNLKGQEGACRGYIFALQVTEELQFWPEQSSHDRKWLNVWEAWKLCRYDWMREALNSISVLISGKPVRLLTVPEMSEPTSFFCLVKSSGNKCVDSAINAFC